MLKEELTKLINKRLIEYSKSSKYSVVLVTKKNGK